VRGGVELNVVLLLGCGCGFTIGGLVVGCYVCHFLLSAQFAPLCLCTHIFSLVFFSFLLPISDPLSAFLCAQAEFERKAANERFAEDLRHADVQRAADAETFAEQIRKVEKGLRADADRLVEETRRFNVELKATTQETQLEVCLCCVCCVCCVRMSAGTDVCIVCC
jgi:hypothetical protein